MPKPRPAAELLNELEQELSRSRIYEARLRKYKKSHLHGLCDQEGTSVTIWINPRPIIVETLLHELIHQRWPDWGEQQVDRAAKRALRALDDRGIDRWYRAYQQAKRATRRTNGLEDKD